MDFAAEEQVFGDGHRGSHRQVLIHRFDALPSGIDRRVKLDRLSVQKHLAFVGNERAGQRLDERGLARAVVADDGEDLAGQQLEVGAIQRGDVTVALDEAARFHHQAQKTEWTCAYILRRDSWSVVTARITRIPVIRI